ncbi:MAG: M3 family metallopeptidase [Bacteroidales bacterium]|uniref:M3 family metallopeptidase n=1 Tax=Candidatus Cryptobacteroides sp. TaxID=2952915 RepID=UPI002A74A192|nr:M3 family metallopeptidase [Candidatus Cryptobacteroides sp.]MDD7235368.1 M3 family metallopeptidase [Bacteroidales bacterium]MDY2702367.1 M3 family metallopeptidase [Candidatus Cryptobacteroides sp.]
MKKFLISLLMLSAAAASCSRNNPFLEEWNTPYGIPPFDEIQLSDYIPAVTAGIEQQKQELDAILANPDAPTFENTVAAYEYSGEILTKVSLVLFNLQETEGNEEMDKVVEEATALMTAHEDEMSMNKAFFERVKAVYDADQSGLTREQQMVLKNLYESFTRSGVALDEASQERLKEINQKIAAAQQKFGTNLLAENNAFKETFGVPVSAYPAEMTGCEDRDRREAMFKAYSSRGNNGNEYDNKALCLEILKLRAEKARMLGFDTFAAYQLDNKMARNPQTVDSFLGQIMGPAARKAVEEIADMQEIMDEDIAAGKLAEGSRIQPWDWFYYAEKVRQRKYALDEELTKPYFKMENVRHGVFAAAEKIYGVKVEPLSGVPVYNEAVDAFKVTDADGSLLGIFMTDYFPRDSKRGGAWMTNFRDQYIDAQGNDIRPIIINVGNMSAPKDSLPALFTIDEVETVFHEFGHALHGLVTKCTYPSVSGTSVARDFVETFSQFNENWAFQPEILAEYAKHYQTGETIPDTLVAKILKAEKFNQGFMTSELCAASILDMKWHELTEEELARMSEGDQAANVAAFEAKVCQEMGLPEQIIPRYRTTYFNHIFNSGYSAGYYSYLWAEVLDKDAFEYFRQQGIYNPEVARSFRENLMERGGSEEPMVLYVRFRGSEPDPGALLRARGL